jgi:hypothetical protein
MRHAGPAPGLSPSPMSATERWRRVPFGWRVVIVIVVAVVVAEYASSVVSGLGGSGGGAVGSSSTYDSSATGTEALAQLLGERGHAVERLGAPLADRPATARRTVFVLDPATWSSADTAALRRDLAVGDRVVLGGRPPTALSRLLGISSPPSWQSAAAGATHPVSAATELTGVHTVISPGPGAYVGTGAPAGTVTPLLRGPGATLAFVAGAGPGSVVLLASSSPLRNGVIGRADNAAFALDLVPSGWAVTFDEYDHGFGRPGTGLAGLPAPWRWGLGLALAAVLVWILSAARRFGPPDPPARIPVPARVRYVDAMATLLSTRPAHDRVEAAEPVRREARRRLCRHLGVPFDAADDVMAARLAYGVGATGVPASTAEAVLRPPATPEDLVALGAALAELERHDRGR